MSATPGSTSVHHFEQPQLQVFLTSLQDVVDGDIHDFSRENFGSLRGDHRLRSLSNPELASYITISPATSLKGSTGLLSRIRGNMADAGDQTPVDPFNSMDDPTEDDGDFSNLLDEGDADLSILVTDDDGMNKLYMPVQRDFDNDAESPSIHDKPLQLVRRLALADISTSFNHGEPDNAESSTPTSRLHEPRFGRRLSRRASSPSVFEMPDFSTIYESRDTKISRRVSVASSTCGSIRVEMFPKGEIDATSPLSTSTAATSSSHLDSRTSLQNSQSGLQFRSWLFNEGGQQQQGPQTSILAKLLAASNTGLTRRRMARLTDVPQAPRFVVLEYSPREIAAQICLIDAELFRNIMREEFASMEWAGRNKMSKSPNIVQATNFFNQIALWVAQEVLNAYEIKQRCQTISFFISVLKASLDLNNLNGVRSILAGMQSTPVYRLARTWEALSKRDRLLYDRISALMSTDNNSEAYRKKINQAKIPCIPYLGIYLGDLTYIYEAWRSVKGDEARVLQCIEREAQMEAVLDEIAKMQSTCYYNLEMNDAIQTGVRAQFYPSESIGAWEKDQYQTSYILEPKRAPGSAILPEARHRSATDGPTTLSEGSKFYLLRPNINLRMPKLPSSSVREESQGSAPSVPPNARGNAALPFRVNTKLGRGGRNVNSLDDAKVVKTEVGVVLSMSHTEKRGKLDLSNTEEVRKDHVEASSYLCKDKSDKYYSGELPPRVEIRPSSDIDLVPLSTSMKSEGEATLIPMRDTGSLDVMPLNSARSSRGPTFGTSRRKERKMQKRRDGTGEELNSDCDLSMNLDGTSRLSTNNVHQSIRSSQASSFGTELDMCQNLSPPSSTILENVKELTLSPPEDILQASKGLRISVEISDFDSIPKSLSPTPFQDCESQPLPKVLTRAGSESQIPSIRSSTATKLMQSHVYIKHETNEDGSRSNRRPWVKCCATLYPTYLCVDSSRTKLRESLFFWVKTEDSSAVSLVGSGNSGCDEGEKVHHSVAAMSTQSLSFVTDSSDVTTISDPSATSDPPSSNRSKKRWAFFGGGNKQSTGQPRPRSVDFTVDGHPAAACVSQRSTGDLPIAGIVNILDASDMSGRNGSMTSKRRSWNFAKDVPGLAQAWRDTAASPQSDTTTNALASSSTAQVNSGFLSPASSGVASGSQDLLHAFFGGFNSGRSSQANPTNDTKKHQTFIDLTPWSYACMATDYQRRSNVLRIAFVGPPVGEGEQRSARTILVRSLADTLGGNVDVDIENWMNAVNGAVLEMASAVGMDEEL